MFVQGAYAYLVIAFLHLVKYTRDYIQPAVKTVLALDVAHSLE